VGILERPADLRGGCLHRKLSYAAHVEGILEFLKSIGKRDVVVAESSAQGPIANGYDAFGYWGLTKKYPVKLMDLNQQGFANADIWQYGAVSNSTKTTITMVNMANLL